MECLYAQQPGENLARDLGVLKRNAQKMRHLRELNPKELLQQVEGNNNCCQVTSFKYALLCPVFKARINLKVGNPDQALKQVHSSFS